MNLIICYLFINILKSIMNIQICHDIFVTPQGAHPYSVQ